MPRLYRSLRSTGSTARRRHRTWMFSMTCATFAWGCWWTDLVMARFVPDVLPSIALVASVASVFAGIGLVAGLLCVRGKNRPWLALAAIPILANASLLATPLLIGDVKHFAQYREVDGAQERTDDLAEPAEADPDDVSGPGAPRPSTSGPR